MKRRLGCLSTTGIAAALLTAAIILAIGLFKGGVLFSSGPLSAKTGEMVGGVPSHASIGGRCSACHVAPWEADSMDDRCLACHVAIAMELENASTFHGGLLAAETGFRCRDCHPEHMGANASLTVVDPDRFPHELTGFSLASHRRMADGSAFTCADCHGEDLARFASATCAACHGDLDPAYMQAHEAAFGQDCLACHDGVETFGADFDHDLLAFPLAGRHVLVDCIGCHQDARSLADLQTTPTGCYACHAGDDAHDGRLGQDCAACHATSDWREATIDHDLTAFPLTGQHADVECQDCHADQVFANTPTNCYACHAGDDAHEGQFGTDCGQCHNTRDWQQATFDHSTTAFPLTGAHVDLPCLQCHTDSVFAGIPSRCAACHAEPEFHIGLLGSDCQSCHSTTAWVPARFDGAHTFPLAHGRAEPSTCQTCHPVTLAAYTCYNCHEHDPGEIEEEHRDEGITDFQDCVRCHPTGREEEGGDD